MAATTPVDDLGRPLRPFAWNAVSWRTTRIFNVYTARLADSAFRAAIDARLAAVGRCVITITTRPGRTTSMIHCGPATVEPAPDYLTLPAGL